jgi:hypothetical protein
MLRILILAFSWLMIAASSWAASWTIGADCRPEDQAKYDQFEQAVRAARPGSTVYVPRPYPASDRQVIVDFLYQYKSWHWERADPKGLPRGEARVLSGILESTVSFQVTRLENWDATRCGSEQRSDFYYLLRIFDVASGEELSRVTLHPSGLWAAKGNSSKGFSFLSLPDPDMVLREEITPSFDVAAERGSAQYVEHLGALVCGWTAPCLAFRQGRDAFVYVRSPLLPRKLFKIAGDEPRYVLQPGDVQRGRLGAIPPERLTGPLFHLGGNFWTVAREVPKRTGPSPRE